MIEFELVRTIRHGGVLDMFHATRYRESSADCAFNKPDANMRLDLLPEPCNLKMSPFRAS